MPEKTDGPRALSLLVEKPWTDSSGQKDLEKSSRRWRTGCENGRRWGTCVPPRPWNGFLQDRGSRERRVARGHDEQRITTIHTLQVLFH